MTKKHLAVLIGILFLGVALIYGITCDNAKTIAELCDVDASDKIVSVTITAPGGYHTDGPDTTYTEGAVFEKYTALFYREEFVSEIPGNLWINTGFFFGSARIQYTFASRESVTVLVPPDYGETADGISSCAALLTAPSDPRKEYALYPKDCLSYEELERLANAE